MALLSLRIMKDPPASGNSRIIQSGTWQLLKAQAAESLSPAACSEKKSKVKT